MDIISLVQISMLIIFLFLYFNAYFCPFLFRIKPLDVDNMDSDQLGAKGKELWDTIVRLETEKYDLEERQKRQDYDVSIPLN